MRVGAAAWVGAGAVVRVRSGVGAVVRVGGVVEEEESSEEARHLVF